MQRLILTFTLFFAAVLGTMGITPSGAAEGTPIMGEPGVTPEQMCSYVQRHNPNFSIEVARAFYTISRRYGIRGDVALCQAILETGWFKFMDGTAVKADQYNFGGMGVEVNGMRGESYASLEEGVTAMMQHIYAYACKNPLPQGETLVDNRFHKVSRGCAPCWEGLSGRWAMDPEYSDKILSIYDGLLRHASK